MPADDVSIDDSSCTADDAETIEILVACSLENYAATDVRSNEDEDAETQQTVTIVVATQRIYEY